MNLEEMLCYVTQEINALCLVPERTLYIQGRLIALYRVRRLLACYNGETLVDYVSHNQKTNIPMLPEEVCAGIRHEMIAISSIC